MKSSLVTAEKNTLGTFSMFKIKILFHYLYALWLGRRFKNRDDLLRWQEKQVRRHLKWVLPHSPYYRERFTRMDGQDWRELPVTEKTEMMERFSEFNTIGVTLHQALEVALHAESTRDFSPMIGDCTVGLSSGTSGHRGLFLANPQERAKHAGNILARTLPGPIWQKNRVAFFLRANSNLFKASASSRLRFEFFDLIRPMNEHIDRLNQLEPTMVFAQPSVLLELARLQESGKIRIQPKRIYSVAEVLDPMDQKRLERIFGQTIHQVYQCTEGLLGVTCRDGVLHLNETCVAFQMEWIDQKAGKFYPILTDFRRTSQPMIRYRLNDILTLKKDPCACGSVTLALEMIEGRSDDVLDFTSLSGSTSVQILPDFIRRCFLMVDSEIEEYRVFQPKPGRLEIHLKGASTSEPRIHDRIRAEIAQLAKQLGFQEPELWFGNDFPRAGMAKLRRVEKARVTPG